MRIDKALNLVVPVETETGIVYVHSTPIAREVFERYFLVISKTFSAIYAEGLNVIAGPRIAAMMLKRIAVDAGVWDGIEGVENGLMAEVRRLSNVAVPTDAGGWSTMPLYDAMTRGHISKDDVLEAEGCIVFFICISAMHRRAQVAQFLDGMGELWSTETTSLNSTEYANSLLTLSATETFSETVKQSSLPG